jgi:3-deoxy-D-manno-octulosonate 8-phosphate phosphatase (KDO 8-P phosphatase)
MPDRATWARIRLFAMDVDGILTDGSVVVSSDGTESKRFSVLDGMGLGMARDAGIEIAWISGRPSEATTVRAGELGIARVIQGRRDKRAILEELAADLGLGLAECLYMGDDLIDVPALLAAGIGVSVPNATAGARAAAQLITRKAGGDGAVREVCDRLLSSRRTASRNTPAPARTIR